MKVIVTFKMESEDLKKFKARAKKEDRSVSSMIRVLIEKYLAE